MKNFLDKLNALRSDVLDDLKERRDEWISSLQQIKKNLQREIDSRIDKLYKAKDLVKEALSSSTIAKHKKFKVWFFYSFLNSRVRHLISAPFIYSMIIPAIILDVFLEIYHRVCFFLYNIPYVKRSEYFAFDRKHLSYLNFLEKINCLYCSYFNWLMSYTKEIAWRTEKYWCPIKHAKRISDPHAHYDDFIDYLDWENYRKKLSDLRCFDKDLDNG